MVEIRLKDDTIISASTGKTIHFSDHCGFMALFELDQNPQLQWNTLIESLSSENISRYDVEGEIYSSCEIDMIMMISDEYQYIQLVLK